MRSFTVPALASVISCLMLSACATDPTPAVSGAFADSVPMWLGGMPRDVPPRRGTPEYDVWMAKRAEEAARPKTGRPQ